jgi:hypothetical protein
MLCRLQEWHNTRGRWLSDNEEYFWHSEGKRQRLYVWPRTCKNAVKQLRTADYLDVRQPRTQLRANKNRNAFGYRRSKVLDGNQAWCSRK